MASIAFDSDIRNKKPRTRKVRGFLDFNDNPCDHMGYASYYTL